MSPNDETDEKRQEGVIHLGRIRRVSTWTRDDRHELERCIGGMSDLLLIGEAVLTQEKYGLSVAFQEEGPVWVATDPAGRYQAEGCSPCAAIIMWDLHRQDFEGSNRPSSDEP